MRNVGSFGPTRGSLVISSGIFDDYHNPGPDVLDRNLRLMVYLCQIRRATRQWAVDGEREKLVEAAELGVGVVEDFRNRRPQRARGPLELVGGSGPGDVDKYLPGARDLLADLVDVSEQFLNAQGQSGDPATAALRIDETVEGIESLIDQRLQPGREPLRKWRIIASDNIADHFLKQRINVRYAHDSKFGDPQNDQNVYLSHETIGSERVYIVTFRQSRFAGSYEDAVLKARSVAIEMKCLVPDPPRGRLISSQGLRIRWPFGGRNRGI